MILKWIITLVIIIFNYVLNYVSVKIKKFLIIQNRNGPTKFLRSMMTPALWKAVFDKNLREVRYLVVDEKVDVNETNPQHVRTFALRLDVVFKTCSFLLRSMLKNFETPLICATKKGCLDIVKFLVEVGKANVNAKDKVQIFLLLLLNCFLVYFGI